MQYTSVYVCVFVCVSVERGGGTWVVLPGLPCGCWCRRVFRKLKQLNFDEKSSDATLNCNSLPLPSIFKKGRKWEEEERAWQAGVLVCGTWQRGKFIMSQLKLTKLSSASSSNLHLSVVFYGAQFRRVQFGCCLWHHRMGQVATIKRSMGRGVGGAATILVAVKPKPQRQPHTSHMACNCFAGATVYLPLLPLPALINCQHTYTHTHTHTQRTALVAAYRCFLPACTESRRHMTLGCKIYKLVARNVTCKIASAATCFLCPAAAAKTLRNMQLN